MPDTAPLKLILGAGEKYTLKIDGAAGYKSSNGKVAAVSAKGVVTGKKAGKSATITVTRKKGKAKKIKGTLTGVVVEGVPYGTLFIKNVGTWAVEFTSGCGGGC